VPKQKRHKTNYAGVYYIDSFVPGTKKPDRIYYIRYRRDNKTIEEKAGRQSTDDMTPARASGKRTDRLEGKQFSNSEIRLKEKADDEAALSKWTVKKLWKEYKSNKGNIKGIATDENRFNNYIEPTFGKYEPSEIDFLSVERFRSKLRGSHSLRCKDKKAPLLTPGTIKNILELLRRIINYGRKNNLCDGINFTIEMPKYDPEKTEDLSSEQLKNLLKAIEKSDNIIAASMMLVALYSGMRRGEMFKLEWSDIDFNRGFILLRDPKGIKNQKIPLSKSAKQIFENIPKTSTFVFPGRDGGQRVDIKKAVNKIKESAGIPKDFRALHGLRHVYASMLASSGQVDMYTLQKLMTHKSPQMTQRYAHLRDETLKKASNLASDIIQKTMNQGSKKPLSINKKTKA